MGRKNKNAIRGEHSKRKGRTKRKKPAPWNSKPRIERELERRDY